MEIDSAFNSVPKIISENVWAGGTKHNFTAREASFTIYSQHKFDLERNQKVDVFKAQLAEEMAKAITNGFKQAVWLNWVYEAKFMPTFLML